MKRVFAGIVVAGVLFVPTGCAAVGGEGSRQPGSEPTALSEEATTIVPENGDVGVCHSASIALTILGGGAVADYRDSSLSRASFNVVVGNIARSFGLIRILHGDATLVPTAQSLGSAIGDLASAEGEPSTGDGSEVGKLQSALSTRCDEVGAPLSIYQ